MKTTRVRRVRRAVLAAALAVSVAAAVLVAGAVRRGRVTRVRQCEPGRAH